MDRAIIMNSFGDLPEPTRREYTPAEKIRRQWNLLVTFLTFVAIYATLHKLFIPYALSFTGLRGSPYAQIDWWFLHPVLLAVLLQRSGRNTSRISFLAGLAIVYGIYEVYEASQGRYTGWLMFSRLLSAVPVAVGCGYLMSRRRFGGDFRAAWFGALLLLATIGLREWQLNRPAAESESPAAVVGERGLPDGEFSSCGAQALTVQAETQGARSSQVAIAECGLSPSVLFLNGNQIEITNNTPQAANIRFFENENGKTQSKWNILVPAGAKAYHSLVLSTGAAGFLISDSAPALGLVAILPGPLPRAWKFSRKPIYAGPVP